MKLPRRLRDALPPGLGVNLGALGLADGSEAEFQAVVVQIAERGGWSVYHIPDSRRVTDDGFPDLVCKRVRSGRRELLVAELKKRGEVPRTEQWEWLWAFEAAGTPAYFWGPDDLDTIREVLK